MPMVWAAVSRALERKANVISTGVVALFVDDFMGLSSKKTAVVDQSNVENMICSVFNNEAVALDKKCVPSYFQEIIGWNVNLENNSYGPNNKGINKLLLVFWSVNYDNKITLKSYQIIDNF
jgi:hypothetical protein